MAQSKSGPVAPDTAADAKEWPTYGHDSGGMRFSPLTEINSKNVARLKVAWVYHMRPADATRPFLSSESTPLVANGVMYLSTPYARVVAIDPTDGHEIWAFHLPSGSASTRGVEYWPGDEAAPQIVFGSNDGKLYSLDAKTGKQTRRSAITAWSI